MDGFDSPTRERKRKPSRPHEFGTGGKREAAGMKTAERERLSRDAVRDLWES